METMKVGLQILVVLVAITLVQGSRVMRQAENLDHEKHSKPIKSFEMGNGDILDCVEFYKQPAFFHPLLRNHTIQRKPTRGVPTQATTSQFLSKNIRCPKGTVLIRRIQDEDLSMAKFASSLYELPKGHQVATVILPANNVGVKGTINVWGPTPAGDQTSSASIFVASDDGSVTNSIVAGWTVNPSLFPNTPVEPNNTHLFAFWTRDSGKTTGCINMFCQGFVQASEDVTLGMVLQPQSIVDGAQYEAPLSIEQDTNTKNWWVYYLGKPVGYYPKELFTTLANGATRGGWGGEVTYDDPKMAIPDMGSGYPPEKGFQKAAYIREMMLFNNLHEPIYPDKSTIQVINSLPRCYEAVYGGAFGDNDHFMSFGGAKGCP